MPYTEYDYIRDQEEGLKYTLDRNPEIDPAMYWSGRMAMIIERLGTTTPSNFSEEYRKLYLVTQKYNEVIFARTK